LGQDTRAALADVLYLDEATLADFVARGVIFDSGDATR
jgi:hypothetical protein